MALKPPVEVPQGAIRLNTDSQKLEFYAQDQWWEMATDVQGDSLQGGSGRGLVMQGIEPSQVNSISYIDITNTGTGYDFGDATANKRAPAGCGSRTRALSGGGNNDGSSGIALIDSLTTASLGNAIPFGDLMTGRYALSATGNQTRAVFVGGTDGTTDNWNVIEFVNFASSGNAQDFGDLSVGRYSPSALSDSHGGLGGF